MSLNENYVKKIKVHGRACQHCERRVRRRQIFQLGAKFTEAGERSTERSFLLTELNLATRVRITQEQDVGVLSACRLPRLVCGRPRGLYRSATCCSRSSARDNKFSIRIFCDDEFCSNSLIRKLKDSKRDSRCANLRSI